jgi:integrase
MTRTVRDSKLDSRAARDKLKPRAKPYYKMLIPGTLHLGYRRRRKGLPGRWLVRRYVGLDANGVGRYRAKEIGLVDDFLDADGEVVFNYAQAQQRAHEWRTAGEGDAQPAAGPLTVSAAIDKYAASLDDKGQSGKDAKARAALHILPALGSLLVEELTTKRLQRWLADMAKLPARVPRSRSGVAPRYKLRPDNEETRRQRKSTANRNRATLKAALNHCFDEGLVKSNDAWGRRFKPFKQADGVRGRFLDNAEAKRLINACDPDFRNLVRAALYTGARYSELARLLVADFHSSSGTVFVGRSKSGKSRHIILTDEGIAFFQHLCVGRGGGEILLRKSNGKAWGPAVQKRPMAAAVQRANITPSISFHGLRHTYASLSITGGVPLLVLAKNLGHADTRMLERNYGHLEDSYERAAIRAGAPRFGEVQPGNVVPLGKAGG